MTNRAALSQQQIDSLEKAVALPKKRSVFPRLNNADRRLIEDYIDYIRKTGQYDFMPLVDLAHQAYLVTSGDDNEFLLPRKIKLLCHNAGIAVKEIELHSEQLRDNINLLGQYLVSDGDSGIAQVTKAMTHDLASISKAVSVLEDLANKYGPSSRNWFARCLSSFSNDTEQEETEYFIRYHKEGLRYILSFLDNHAQPDVIRLECPQGKQWHVYACRLLSYCNGLMLHSQNLSDKIQQLIQETEPDAAFAPEMDVEA